MLWDAVSITSFRDTCGLERPKSRVMHAGSLGSHAAVEQLQPFDDKGASPAEHGPPQGVTPAASANVGTSLPLGCPPLHRAARPGSSGMRTRPSAPPFASGPAHSSRGAGAAVQNGDDVQQNGDHEPPRYTGSSPLQTPPVRGPNQATAHDSPPVQDADLHTGVRDSLLWQFPSITMSMSQPQSVT